LRQFVAQIQTENLLSCFTTSSASGSTTLQFLWQAWSVFGRPIRTNNDVEGWHKRINSQAHSQQSINMYLLIDKLHKESVNVNLQIQFLLNGAVLRYQRAKYRKMQAIIFKAWQNLSDGEISAKHLLKLCSRLNGPTISMNSPDAE
jgi:hypothetical protein